MVMDSSFGELFKEMRQRTGLTLRKFCLKHNLDPGNMSRMERGLIQPPTSREKLKQYATYLQIKEGSDEWYEFFDRAAASAGRIPEYMMDDAELVKRLPYVFRTLRGQKLDIKKLDELVEVIKRS
ncbi:MAG TPA: helix-turn-helix transcriptional regulator [Thermodesulfobacteriota bacterium]|nr:helix-turn-helix transcriptional regulator [Thermodesulfobacteriota bacterium]